MKIATLLLCLSSLSSLSSCKTMTSSATTKDALIPIGPATASGTPFALFVNDLANKQMCAIECNDVNPVQIPADQATFANRLRCNVDMICQPINNFFTFYLSATLGATAQTQLSGTAGANAQSQLDLFFDSLIAGFTVYPDATFAQMAQNLVSNLKANGKHQPISPELVDQYLTRKASAVYNTSTNPDMQKQLDTNQAKLDVLREQARIAAVAEAARQAKLAQEQAAAAAKQAIIDHLNALRSRLGALPTWNALCPSNDNSTVFSNTPPVADGLPEALHLSGQENNCLNSAFSPRSDTPLKGTTLSDNPAIEANAQSLPHQMSISISPEQTQLSFPASLGTDVDGYHLVVFNDDAFTLLDQLHVGFTQPDVIYMASFSQASMGNGSAQPMWDIRCDLSGTDGGAYPRCQIDMDRTMNHQRFADQLAAQAALVAQQQAAAQAAQAQAQAQAQFQAEQAAIDQQNAQNLANAQQLTPVEIDNGTVVEGEVISDSCSGCSSDDSSGLVDAAPSPAKKLATLNFTFAVNAPLQAAGTFQFDGTSPVQLLFSPKQFMRYFSFTAGDNCKAAAFSGSDVSAAGSLGTRLTPINTLKTPDRFSMVYLVNNGKGAFLSQVNLKASGKACSDLQFFESK